MCNDVITRFEEFLNATRLKKALADAAKEVEACKEHLRNADQQERDAAATLADILKAVDGLAGTLVVVAARLRSSKPKLTTPRPARLVFLSPLGNLSSGAGCRRARFLAESEF